MADERERLFARLAVERGELLHQLLRLDELKLTQKRFLNGWSVKDLLAHVAACDRREHVQMKRMAGGQAPEQVARETFNELAAAQSADRSLE